MLEPPVEPAGRGPLFAMWVRMPQESGSARRERVDIGRLEARRPAPEASGIEQPPEAFAGGPQGAAKQEPGELRRGDIAHPAGGFQDLHVTRCQPELCTLAPDFCSASTPHHRGRPMAVGFHTAWLHRGHGMYAGVRPHPGVGHGAKALPRNVLLQ